MINVYMAGASIRDWMARVESGVLIKAETYTYSLCNSTYFNKFVVQVIWRNLSGEKDDDAILIICLAREKGVQPTL